MFHSVRSKERVASGVKFNPVVTLLQPVEKVVDGQLTRQSQFVAVDIADSLRVFTSADFSIGNMLATGAFDKLKSNCIVNTSRILSADSFDNFKVPENVQS